MAINSVKALIIFFTIYCASQGSQDGWDEAFELNYLQEHGVSPMAIAVAQSLGIFPMAFKSIFAYPSDKLRLRRIFCAAGIVLSGASFLLMVTFDPKV